MRDAFCRHDKNDDLILRALDAVEKGHVNTSEVNLDLSTRLTDAFYQT